MPARRSLPDDIADRIEQGMSIADLARHYEWSRDTMRWVLKRDAPDLAEQAIANGREVQRIAGRLVMQKVTKERAIQKRAARRRDRSTEPFMDLSKEKLISRVTQAVRHLQRQRLGPCYPWKDGYYWMGKCLDANALMAEAERRGWNEWK